MGCCNSKNGAASESSDMFDFDSVSDVLRELLTEAIEFAIKMVSKVGGFLANKDIKIPWPAEVRVHVRAHACICGVGGITRRVPRRASLC